MLYIPEKVCFTPHIERTTTSHADQEPLMKFPDYGLAVIRQTGRLTNGLRFVIDAAHLRACFEVRLGIAEAAARLVQHYSVGAGSGHI